jgi:shikimate dehydrogenase
MKAFTIDQLEAINLNYEHPARYGVIGNPVAHSLSPQLHQPALDKLGENARYVRVQVESGEVEKAFDQMFAAGFRGINVTVPHKLEALSACHDVDPAARIMGAVNTIVFDEQGRRKGFNTDGPGFARAIREEFGVDLGDLRVMIIGAGGGAGRAIATQCALENCSQLILVNRTVEKITTMKKELLELENLEILEGPRDRIESIALSSPHLKEAMGASDLIINTTSVGLKTTDGTPFSTSWIEPHHLVYDTIYNPERTQLLREAQIQGARVANGLSLLIHQGALSLEYWLGKIAPIDQMRAGVKNALRG